MRARPEDARDPEAANARFREEARRWGLVFRCEDCAHLAPAAGACSLGYPNGMLRGEVRAVTPSGLLTFCKSFELSE